jgi:hypothetical protein
MMIPSEMPSVTMGENGHGNGQCLPSPLRHDEADDSDHFAILGHFKAEAGNVFQSAEQMMR